MTTEMGAHNKTMLHMISLLILSEPLFHRFFADKCASFCKIYLRNSKISEDVFICYQNSPIPPTANCWAFTFHTVLGITAYFAHPISLNGKCSCKWTAMCLSLTISSTPKHPRTHQMKMVWRVLLKNKSFGFDLFKWNRLLCRNVNDVSVAIQIRFAWLHLNSTCQLISTSPNASQTFSRDVSLVLSMIVPAPMALTPINSQRKWKISASALHRLQVKVEFRERRSIIELNQFEFCFILFDLFMRDVLWLRYAVRHATRQPHTYCSVRARAKLSALGTKNGMCFSRCEDEEEGGRQEARNNEPGRFSKINKNAKEQTLIT